MFYHLGEVGSKWKWGRGELLKIELLEESYWKEGLKDKKGGGLGGWGKMTQSISAGPSV